MTTNTMLARLTQPYGSFPEILSAWAEIQPDKLALLDEKGSVTWAELDQLTARLAARLVETGLERGQSVAILGTSCINYAVVFLAAVRAGGVAAPLTTSASPEQLAGMAKDSGARHLFIDTAKADELGAAFLPELEHVPLEDVGSWMAPAGTDAPAFKPDPKDAFNIIYSSGTTGIPKGDRSFASNAVAAICHDRCLLSGGGAGGSFARQHAALFQHDHGRVPTAAVGRRDRAHHGQV